MAENSKVVLSSGEVLMDLTDDTVSSDSLLEGVTAHDASGVQVVGTLSVPNRYLTADVFTGTLSASSWSGSSAPYTYTLTNSLFSGAISGSVGLGSGVTDEQYSAAAKAKIAVSGFSGTTLTLQALGEAPSVDIPYEMYMLYYD